MLSEALKALVSLWRSIFEANRRGYVLTTENRREGVFRAMVWEGR